MINLSVYYLLESDFYELLYMQRFHERSPEVVEVFAFVESDDDVLTADVAVSDSFAVQKGYNLESFYDNPHHVRLLREVSH